MPLRAAVLTLLLLGAAVAPASASYPGDNGRLSLTYEPTDGARALYTMQPDGSDVRTLTTPGRGVYSATWSADGGRIVFHESRNLYMVNADGSGEVQLTNDFESLNPALSPDGKTVAFVRGNDVYTMDLDGTNLRSYGRGSVFSGPRFSPDGKWLVFSREGQGTPEPSGYVPQTFRIVIARTNGTGEEVLTPESQRAHGPSFSPDGQKIVFATDTAVRVMNRDGSANSALPSPGGNWQAGPVYSPDGTQIAYYGFGPAGTGVHFVDPDGSNLRVLALTVRNGNLDIDWQPIPVPEPPPGPPADPPGPPVDPPGPPADPPGPPAGGPPAGPPADPPVGPPCDRVQEGTAKRNLLTGTDAGDLIRGLAGDDRLNGGAGRDCLFGGAGRDRLSGGAGNDRLNGFRGADTLTGGSGRDRLKAGTGNDTVRAGDGEADKVDCGAGRDSAVVDELDRVDHCERVRVLR
jgi:dipeptidyl aminopeptidase/acylaminoacyl peptidase